MAVDDESIGIEDKIKSTIDRLTECLLGDTERKHGLPGIDAGTLSSFQVLLPNLKTGLYELSAKGNYHQVEIALTLNVEKIEEISRGLATRRTPDPAWAFLGFIKDTPFNAGSIKPYNSMEELSTVADINTQSSGALFTPLLKESMPHSALFLVAFDTDETFTVEADRLATLRLPPAPKIDEITELKEKLAKLMSIKIRGDRKQSVISPQPNPPPDNNAKRDNIIAEYEDKVEWINSKLPEEERAAQLEAAAMKMRNALWDLMG
jgi:hypothetical protein